MAGFTNKNLTIDPEKKQIITNMIAAIVAVTLAALLSWQYIVLPYNDNLFEKNISTLANIQQSAISNYQQSVLLQLKKITHDKKNISLIKNNIVDGVLSQTNPSILRIQQHIINSIGHSKIARIYAPREAQAQKDAGGDIRFVELNMINNAEKNKTFYPEAAKTADRKSWEIHWVIGIPNLDPPTTSAKEKAENIKPLAILHLTTTLDGLSNTLIESDPGLTQTKLIQNIGRQQQLTFILLGEGSNSNVRIIDVPSSYWQIAMSPSADFQGQKTAIPLLFIIAVLLVLITAILSAYLLTQQSIKKEAALYHVIEPASPEKTTDNNEATNDNETKADKEDAENTESSTKSPIHLHDQETDNNPVDTDLDDNSAEIPKHIFRDYDIRGIVDTDISPIIAQLVGKAVASKALSKGNEAILIGRDARTHSPTLFNHLVQGVLSTGCNVIDMGIVPTPLVNFAVATFNDSNSGISITASHNPKEYNGFKIILGGETLTSPDIQKLYQTIVERDFVVAEEKGQLTEETFNEDYIDTVSADIAIDSDLHIVIDASNGASSHIAPALFNELGCKVTPLHCEFDGDFPNHDPDPSIEDNLTLLIEAVKHESADIGIALDGDGDRLVVVTSSGKVIWPDQLLMIFARDVVSRNPGCDIIFDIKSTRRLNQIISSYGGRPIMWKTGHSNIKAKMRETNALLAGEFSGHIFFKERWFGFDDGLYAAARLMEIMSLRDQSLDSMIDAMPPLFMSPEIKIEIPEAHKFTLIDNIIQNAHFSSGEKTLIDGLRVDFENGWGLVRASNTSPAITLRFEADSAKDLDQIKSLFRQEITAVDPTITLDF